MHFYGGEQIFETHVEKQLKTKLYQDVFLKNNSMELI